MSPLDKYLVSLILYFNMANLVKPKPKAKPEYSSGSIPPALKTSGWINPAPTISNQPVFLQTRQPLP